ncbi:MAG TPA: (2Fe-2S)-binding protein, partial [Thermoanaerobaculia bacterium]|nr:(2Fe-2S)-binding protein [Thermoanaerobaculia bacterium]
MRLLTPSKETGIIRVLRLSLIREQERTENEPGTDDVIICICRGKNERDVMRAIDNGATTIRDLQRCGIGDQCGSCHNSLRAMLAEAASSPASTPC